MAWIDKRPLSPHLQIYRMPITAMLSVLHRGTGVILLVGLQLMIAVLVSVANGAESWQMMHRFLSGWFGLLLLLGFSFSLYYHLCNGVRHLLWDIGKGLSLVKVHQSAWIVLVSSIVLTLLTWIMVLL